MAANPERSKRVFAFNSEANSMPTLLMFFVLLAPIQDRQPATAENPLAALKEEVKRVLAEARLPFTEEQERTIVLMMEDRRKASEELFGNLMDFSNGPTQGQNADRMRSAIEWMRNEFVTRLQNYLTAEQLGAWSRHQETSTPAAASASSTPRNNASRQQTQFVRINNNAFTAEEGGYRQGGGGNTEVIQRGGAGAWHGNTQFTLKDDALNAARRSYSRGVRIPTVKPTYREHQTGFNLSGPLIPGRLTASINASHNRGENVDTVSAIRADGIPFGAEIVRPTINRNFRTGGTLQITNRNSLNYNVNYSPYSRLNQGIGGFTLPERSYAAQGNDWGVNLNQFSSLSAQSIYEMRFNISGGHDQNVPANNGVRINVLDAYNGGGAQNESDTKSRIVQFSNLYTRLGEKLTIKTGVEGNYNRQRSVSKNNYGGTFTFSSLEGFRAGTPTTYRVTRGEPLQNTSQLAISFFMQNDLKLTPRLTLMYGLRYDTQTNLSDHNNFGPRLSLAYALGQGTVIRAGGGVYYNGIGLGLFETQKRLDGKTQYEIVIDNPSYPDPLQSGSVRSTTPSIRVTDAGLAQPYITAHMISFEKTFLTNLFFSVAYEFRKEIHRTRLRNINAARDITSPTPRSCTPGQSAETCQRPDPSKGQILQLESSLGQTDRDLRVNVRKRFSIFNFSANYTYQRVFTDGAPNAGGELAADSYNLADEWARASNFPRHTVNSTLNAQMPLGIFLQGQTSFNTSRRYNITTGKDDNMDSQVNDRPGLGRRNTGATPTVFTVNFNISKAFFFGAPTTGGGGGNSRANLNVFANMDNAFNHVNYGAPSGVMTSPNFGFSTSGGEPRQIEVGMRFQF